MSKWLEVLQQQCDSRSQSSVAEDLGVSATTINQVLKRIYKGRTDRIKSMVEGKYMGAKVDCPVIGELPRDRCMQHQSRRKFAATNPLRVQLHRTCPTCPNYQPGGES
jgi:DNA-binding Lrp family transcriptional regulator